ncbi:MAG: hypothetical protein JXR05_16055 [Flavobacteriaceae bacterium]
MKKPLFYVLLNIILLTKVHGQHLTHDVGIHIGASAIITDYGVRGDFLSSYGNRGTYLSINHSIHFFHNNLKWNYDHPVWSHLAIKNEISFLTKTNLRHYGSFVERDNVLGNQLRAMTGSVSILSVGFQLEYYFYCLRTFLYPYTELKINPYMMMGLRHNWYKNTLNSTLGDWRENPQVLPQKWRPSEALAIGNGTDYSLLFGGGIRYRIQPAIDVNIQLSWQYFFSDAIDGLTARVDENIYNEWTVNFQVGLIFHLNFSKPLSLF